jgi:Asp-tRNA(Asn)/Glu-tRNA(Gln) amidotransferase B subunit
VYLLEVCTLSVDHGLLRPQDVRRIFQQRGGNPALSKLIERLAEENIEQSKQIVVLGSMLNQVLELLNAVLGKMNMQSMNVDANAALNEQRSRADGIEMKAEETAKLATEDMG